MKRNLSLDILKLVFAAMVVAAHSGFGKDISFSFRYMYYNGLVRVAVPTFFVINGYFFYQNVVVGKVKFETWRNKLAALYAIWALIYLPGYLPHTQKLDLFMLQLSGTIFFGWFHLWYLVSTLGAGLILYHFLRNKSTRFMIILSAFIYAVGLGLQYAGNYHLIQDETIYNLIEDIAVSRNFLFFGLPFLVIGYLLARHDILNRVQGNATLLVWTALSVLLVLGEAALNLHFLAGNRGFDLLFTTPLVGPMLFLAAQKFPKPTNSNLISNLSTGVYLIHPLFLMVIIGLKIESLTAITLATILLSALASWLLLKFNLTRKWLF